MGLLQVRDAILAQNSDLFDVLAYVYFASEPKTRAERAEGGSVAIKSEYDTKLAAFLEYVLGQYVDTGADGLDRSNLPDYLKLKYGTFTDGARAFGSVESLLQSYVAFQKHLYV